VPILGVFQDDVHALVIEHVAVFPRPPGVFPFDPAVAPRPSAPAKQLVDLVTLRGDQEKFNLVLEIRELSVAVVLKPAGNGERRHHIRRRNNGAKDKTNGPGEAQ
jgi:hypothetical protein